MNVTGNTKPAVVEGGSSLPSSKARSWKSLLVLTGALLMLLNVVVNFC